MDYQDNIHEKIIEKTYLLKICTATVLIRSTSIFNSVLVLTLHFRQNKKNRRMNLFIMTSFQDGRHFYMLKMETSF